jgi:hypothetical protein
VRCKYVWDCGSDGIETLRAWYITEENEIKVLATKEDNI